MALETGTYISDLVSTNPVGTDTLDKADEHLRLLKSTIKATFPNITGAVTATHTELNFVDGVTSAIQTQLDAKANLPSAQSFLRNRLINGDMRIDQRNAGASVTPVNSQYLVDRFLAAATQTGKFSVQQNAGAVTPPTGFKNYLGVTSLSAYSVLSTDIFAIQHRLEGYNIADWGWGAAGAATATLSFWVRSSLTGTHGGAFTNYASNRSYPFTYTINSANTWEFKTVTVVGDTTGTWPSDNSGALVVCFGLGGGSTLSGTSGAWAAGNLLTATGAVSVVGTNAATWYVTGVQLEAGSVATPFERRQYGTELALCQRYYQTGPLTAIGAGTGGANFAATYSFKVQMRAVPTVSQGANNYLFASSNITGTTSTYAGDVNGVAAYRVCTATGACQFSEATVMSAEL